MKKLAVKCQDVFRTNTGVLQMFGSLGRVSDWAGETHGQHIPEYKWAEKGRRT